MTFVINIYILTFFFLRWFLTEIEKIIAVKQAVIAFATITGRSLIKMPYISQQITPESKMPYITGDKSSVDFVLIVLIT